MVSTPRKKNCYGCVHSRLIKGARCYCSLRQAVVLESEVVAVAECALAEEARHKAERLVAEARAARAARQQVELSVDAQPVATVG